MIFSLGYVYSVDKPNSHDVLIYKIGEYANFTEVDNFIFTNNDTVTNTIFIKILWSLIFIGIIVGVIGYINLNPYCSPRRIEV